MSDNKAKIRPSKSKNQPKSSNTRNKKVKKRKTRVTREYQKNEEEVQHLLKQKEFLWDVASTGTATTNKYANGLLESIDFFCKLSCDNKYESIRKQRKAAETDIGAEKSSTEDEPLADDDDVRDNTDYRDISEDKYEATDSGADENGNQVHEREGSASALASLTRSTQPSNIAESFIRIDLEDAPVTQMRKSKPVYLNNDLLYNPRSVIDVHVGKIANNAGALEANTTRLLNRYYVEAGEDATRLEEFMEKLTLHNNQPAHSSSRTLYRTLCDFRFRPIFCQPTQEAVALPTRKFIKLHLKELRFTEHAMLQTEHRLANLLIDYYQAYSQRLNRKEGETLKASLQAERKIVNDLLKRETTKASQDSETQVQRAASLTQHLLVIKELRHQLYQAEAEKKRLLEQTLQTWMELKKLRQERGYQCTRLRLRIVARDDDIITEAKRSWQQRYERDLNEMMREELEAYYRAKRHWKLQHYSSENHAADFKRPKKPNVGKLARVLKRQLIKSFGKPGEPRIEISLTRLSDEKFYELRSPPLPKSLTQQHSRGPTYFMKLFFDGQVVGMTRSYRLEPDLSLNINEKIGIFLERRLPRGIKISLYEKSKLPKVPIKVANIIVPLPLGSDRKDLQAQSVSFSSHKQATSGRLDLRFECEESIYPDDMVKVLFPPPKERIKISEDIVKKWPDDNLFSSQQNTVMLNKGSEQDDEESLTDDKRNNQRQSHSRTCTFQEDLLQFCSTDQLENSRRFRLLRSRFQRQNAHTRDVRFVPALEHELVYDDNDEEAEAVIDAGNWMDPIDVHKHEGKKYLNNLYEAIRNQCFRLSKTMDTSENLLVSDETGTISSLFQAFLSIFSFRRPLNPSRNSSVTAIQSSRIPESTNVSKNFRIILNVVRATGIPVRSSPLNLDNGVRQHKRNSLTVFTAQQSFEYSNVRPFIALSYRDRICRTMTAEGSNPTWNEEIQLEFNEHFENLRDDIKISLFDEVIENQINDDISVRNVDVYQRIQTNWLGEYRIPITTLLKNRKIEGVFQLSMPKVLLGYQQPSFVDTTSGASTNIIVDQMPEIRESTHLWFYISLEPLLQLSRHFSAACLECSELHETRQHLHEWCLNVKEMQPNRFIDPLVCTEDGKRVCITRLLEAIPLPMEASETSLDSVCRYVALFSVLKGYETATGFDGVWLNNQCVLNTTWASAKDLGILLANFMLSIGIHCSVVLCFAHPHGQSAFVLYRSSEYGEYMLADPCSGRRYFVNDVFCPITKVYYIIASDNIYCNIQSETRIAMLNFDVNDSTCWLPAFNRKKPAPQGGVQLLNYTYTDCFAIVELRKNVERKIMKKINTWRAMRKTIWNRAFQTRLLRILLDLEASCTFVNSSAENQVFQYGEQLAREFPNYTLYGFTLNFSYTNLSSISARIKSTGIHLNSNKDVEFSSAVHIHPHRNNVLSVWIFLISVVPNNRSG